MRTASTGMLLLAGFALAAFPTRAHTADISDLQESYSGSFHGNTRADLEDLSIFLEVSNVQPNGKFTANFGTASAPGKVTPKGKLTVEGTLVDVNLNVKIKLSGQLSATGQFIVGTASLKGTLDGQQVNEKFTATLEAGSPL